MILFWENYKYKNITLHIYTLNHLSTYFENCLIQKFVSLGSCFNWPSSQWSAQIAVREKSSWRKTIFKIQNYAGKYQVYLLYVM